MLYTIDAGILYSLRTFGTVLAAGTLISDESNREETNLIWPALTVYLLYIRTVSSELLLCTGTYVFFLAGLGQKSILLYLHIALPKRPIN